MSEISGKMYDVRRFSAMACPELKTPESLYQKGKQLKFRITMSCRELGRQRVIVETGFYADYSGVVDLLRSKSDDFMNDCKVFAMNTGQYWELTTHARIDVAWTDERWTPVFYAVGYGSRFVGV